MYEGTVHHRGNLLFIVSLLQRPFICLGSLMFNQMNTAGEGEVDLTSLRRFTVTSAAKYLSIIEQVVFKLKLREWGICK